MHVHLDIQGNLTMTSTVYNYDLSQTAFEMALLELEVPLDGYVTLRVSNDARFSAAYALQPFFRVLQINLVVDQSYKTDAWSVRYQNKTVHSEVAYNES